MISPPEPSTALKWDRHRDSHWAINTTVRCQHRCLYCFEGRREGLFNVPTAEVRVLLRRAARKVAAVIFMGAEPTLNPDLPGLVAYAHGLGLKVCISTNGMRLASWDYLCSLERAGLDSIEMSFPYPDEAVYERITERPPRGFFRLLAALENIDRMNRERLASHMLPMHVNVNLVVSQLNVSRLGEVIAHLERCLTSGAYRLTVKRVCLPQKADLLPADFQERIHVPCHVLRTALPRVRERVPAEIEMCFRDLPLCATPGCESLHGDLGYFLHDVSVTHNFRDQSNLENMYAETLLWQSHPFDDVCADCALGRICLSRGLFRDVEATPEQAPIPVLGPMPAPLWDWVCATPRGPEVLAAVRPRAPDPPAPPPTETPTAAPSEPPALELRAASPAWEQFVGSALLDRLRSDLAGARLTPLSGGVIRIEPPAGAGLVVVRPRGGPSEPAFLCGPVRVRVIWHCSPPDSLAWESAVCRACLRIDADHAWPDDLPTADPGFLDRVWRVFGLALLPRAGSVGGLVGAEVGDDAVRLRLATGRNHSFEILIRPEQESPNAAARGHGLGLQYNVSRRVAARTDWLPIVRAYVRILRARANAR